MPFRGAINALNQLIILNVLVFVVVYVLLQAVLRLSQALPWYEVVTRQLELSSSLPVLVRHPWTLLTYAFMHDGFLHIIFNMLNLFWFGQLIREYLGNRRLVSIYILGGAGGRGFLPAGL